MNQLLRIGLILGCVSFLFGCTKLNSGAGGLLNLKTDLTIDFKVGTNINPDENGNASPVFVRMYELKDTEGFLKANFIDLYEKDEEILAKSLIAKKELSRFVPGQPRSEKFVLNEETQFVALYAEFFKYKDSNHKVIFPITSKNIIRNTANVTINGNALSLIESEMSRLSQQIKGLQPKKEK